MRIRFAAAGRGKIQSTALGRMTMLKMEEERSLGVRLVNVRHTRESRRRTQFSETCELQQDAGFTSRQLFDAEFIVRQLKDASSLLGSCSMEDSLCGS